MVLKNGSDKKKKNNLKSKMVQIWKSKVNLGIGDRES